MVLAVIGMKFVLGLCAVIGGVAAAIAIWQFVFKPHNAAFTGNVGTYAEAGSLISFLGQHAGQHVNLNEAQFQRLEAHPVRFTFPHDPGFPGRRRIPHGARPCRCRRGR